jgi:RNA polymerase sigma-70 factor (sigma-E family)
MDDPEPDFDDWVRARGAALLRFGYLVTHDRSRAEEAVQDALVALYPRWAKVNRDGDPERYVRRSIVNADITRWRRFRRRETPVADLHALGGVQYDADLVEQDATWRLCATLPTRQRAAVVLRFYEGMADAEIAAVLGCSAGTVRSQIHRALAALRQRLASTEEVSRS